MADPILKYDFEPGYRIVTGSDLNRMIEALNEAFSAQISPDIIGQPNGLATLDANGKVPVAQIPAPAAFGAVDLASAQSIDGVKTFSSNPIVPVPSDGPQVANKNYVDAQATVLNQGKVSVSNTPNIVYGTDGAGAQTTIVRGAANGLATLDGSGKVPTSQINISGLDYQGTWNAATNTPALTNGTGTAGHFYKVSTAGSHDFGAGAIAFNVGDWVIYENAVWDRVGVHEAVASVNAKTGAVVLVAADVGAVAKTGDETVAGIKTFSSSPIVPTPTTAAQAAPKAYVDGLAAPKAPVAVSANKTLTRADHNVVHLVNASAGPITLTIDGANVDPGNTFIVKDTDASSNTITVQMNGGGTVDGGPNYQIGANGFGTVIVQDATHAFVINNGLN